MKFLDANIFVRYFTGDDEQKAHACYRLLERLKEGEEEATTCEAIITDVVHVLSSPRVYGLSHSEVSARLRPVLMLKGLKISHKRLYLRALDLFAAYPFLDFGDAMGIAHMEDQGLTEIMSYDTDFDRISGVHRLEP